MDFEDLENVRYPGAIRKNKRAERVEHLGSGGPTSHQHLQQTQVAWSDIGRAALECEAGC